jgi:hypothetical protein
MCTLPGADCLDASTPQKGRIPADFPLGLGAQDYGSDGHFEGPGRDISGTTPTPCNTDPLASQPALDRLGFADIAIEFEDYRHLTLYADEHAAREVMQSAHDAVAACATEDFEGMTLTWVSRAADTGYDSLTVSQGVRDQIGGTTFQLTRVGRAVLMVAFSGEGIAEPRELTSITRQIAPHLCTFTAGGCGSATSTPSTSSNSTGSAPLCTAVDLDVQLVGLEGAAGSAYTEARFTNTSGHVCSVEGTTSLTAITDAGAAVAGATATVTRFDLPAGRYASGTIRNANPGTFDATECKPSPVRIWRIQVPGGAETLSVAPTGYQDACTAIGNVTIDPWQPVLDGH